MNKSFRQNMVWLHSWSGLLSGWVLYFVFVVGSATYFYMEITRWMQPEWPMRPASQQQVPVATLLDHAFSYLEKQPASQEWYIMLPQNGDRMGCGLRCRALDFPRGYPSDLTVFWGKEGASYSLRDREALDSLTGEPLLPGAYLRETSGGDLFYTLHHRLHYIDQEIGTYIILFATTLIFLALLTGIVAHKRIFKDFFTFRPRKGQRSWLDGHNVASVMGLPFFIIILYSGLVLEKGAYIPEPLLTVPAKKAIKAPSITPAHVGRPIADLHKLADAAEEILGKGEIGEVFISRSEEKGFRITFARNWGTEFPLRSKYGSEVIFDANTGEPLDVPYTKGQQPAWKALWFFSDTHYAWFAGYGLRWLFFASGLLGCVMIATGLVIWTVKRHEKHAKRGDDAPWGVGLAEWLNVSVIVGLPVAIAAYFWANRLLPVTMAERAEWETHCLFLTWGWLFLYAALRPRQRSWVEILWLAAAAFGLIPLLNWLTTDKHLGTTLAAGDWVLAGFDLTMLALAAVFGAMALKLQRKWSGNQPLQTPATRELPV